jgi:hypothetical protein
MLLPIPESAGSAPPGKHLDGDLAQAAALLADPKITIKQLKAYVVTQAQA